jgi:hypothetical protein
MDEWITIVGSSLLGFALGSINLSRQNKVERDAEIRRARLESYSALCAAIIEYRRAQLHRWFVGVDIGSAEQVELTRPEVAQEVRLTRAAAWGQFYKVVMICGDDELERRARAAMTLTKQMKHSATADELHSLSDRVHDAVDEFARHAGVAIRDPKQKAGSPPPSWQGTTRTVATND